MSVFCALEARVPPVRPVLGRLVNRVKRMHPRVAAHAYSPAVGGPIACLTVRLMDCAKIKAEMAEEVLLEPLVITEEGDITEGAAETGAVSGAAIIVQSSSGETAQRGEEEHTREDKNEEHLVSKTGSEEQSAEKQQTNTEENHRGEDKEDKKGIDKPVDTENMNNGQNRGESEAMRISENPETPRDTEDKKVSQNDPQLDIKMLNLSEQQPEGTQSQDEDSLKARRLTPDFPESLYELLCTLQEGRRLNDQRCSFRLESGMRRRSHISSMTSLQREEFFELVATAQARRLDDQRAQLERPRAGWRTSAAGLQGPWMMRTSSPCSLGSRGGAWTSNGLNYHASCKPEMEKLWGSCGSRSSVVAFLV
ncbi:hypothetical protein INR49_001983 [Caranx melampygus]|nr:hypothetical protein INR49_001983 [Caranx melampygus]